MARILVVDDDELWTVLLVRRLERDGHVAEYVTNAEAALEHVANAIEPYEILLIDHRLGSGMDGLELLVELRTVCPSADTILFTGLDDPNIGLQAYEAGAYRYLHKPFEPQELLLIIQSLIHWRDTQYERNWLRILNDIVGELQDAYTVEDVGQILTDGGVRLGFDRARFYTVHTESGDRIIQGRCQSGHNQVEGFETILRPLATTVYCKVAYKHSEPTYFQSRELGPSFLSEMQHTDGQPDSLGEWVSIPLFSGGDCIGILNMDNCKQSRVIPAVQRDLLRLFAGHAASALDQVLRHQQEEQEREVERIVQRIVRNMGDPSESGSLKRLLHAIRNEMLVYVAVPNFLAVFKSRDTDGFFVRLHIEDGEELSKPYWRSNLERGMIWWLLTNGDALFLPHGTQEHRDRYGLKQVGKRAARSWMGTPLLIGKQIVGALIVEDDERESAFQQSHFELLNTLADRLAGVLQTAWLKEQEREYSSLLRQLQQASALITTGFDEEKLWLTTLTLCTADYGAGFDRAMLFLAEERGTHLWGRMAIGHLRWEDAERDRQENERTGINWEKFLSALEKGILKPTPLDEAVRGYEFPVEESVFQSILEGSGVLVLTEQEAQEQFPASFLTRFGITAYSLVPVKAAHKTIGVVVLDNIWGKDPQKLGVLNILDTLTNQAALLYENLRKTQVQEQLIAVQHEILVQSTVRPLKETLSSICQSIQSIAGADLVAIYPIQDNDTELHYDHEHSVSIGRHHPSSQYVSPVPTTLSKYLLQETKQPLFSEDVLTDQTLFFGRKRSEASIIEKKGIRSAIAVPIFDLQTGKPRGILYIDYHTQRQFTDFDRRMAESFAYLIATAIGNWRDAQGLRDIQEARDDELRKLSWVLKRALEIAQDENSNNAEEKVIELLLNAVPSLFEISIVSAGITLKRWVRFEGELDPIEMHEYLYPRNSGLKSKLIRRSEDTGINNRAIASNTTQNVPDVRKDSDYRRRSKESKTLSSLDVPITLDGRVIGAFNIESPTLAAFTPHHQEMAERFAGVATLTLGNVRRQRNLRTVLDAVRSITAPTELPVTLRQIAESIRMAVPNLSSLTIWHKQPHNSELTLADSYFGVVNEEALLADYPREDGMVRYAMTLHNPLWISDVMQNERFASKKFVEVEGIRSTAIFPLRAQDEAVGVMFFSYRSEHIFTDEEKRLYPILAEVAASAIQDALLMEKAHKERLQAEKARKRFQMALDVTETMSQELDQEEVIREVLPRITEDDLFPDTTAAILRYDRNEHSLSFTPASLPFYFHEDPEHPSIRSIPVNEISIAAAVARMSLTSKQTAFINEGNVQDNPEYLSIRLDTQSQFVSTLWSDEKGLIGVLVLESTKRNAFDEDAEDMALLLTKQVRLAVERAWGRDELEVKSTVAAATAWATEIAHDIEQEIFNIRSGVDALREFTDAAGRRYLDRIDASAARLVTATPPESQSPESLLIDNYLNTVVNRLARELNNSIETEFVPGCENLEIESYPLAIERILRHLLRNADRAMLHQRRKVIRIETEKVTELGQIEIRITDSGPGIPPEHQHLLFRRRISQNRNGYGGLGLLLVSFLLQTIGGTIRLLPSQPGWGATFAIRLPLHTRKNLEATHG